MGFQKSYVIFRLGHGKCLRPLTRWVGGVKKGQKHAYVILEWSLIKYKFQHDRLYFLKFLTGRLVVFNDKKNELLEAFIR